ncbi:MAG: hypothetical protein IV085_10510 [Thiobacillus sp.]|nr:hypothetical protein [Thiobacillus sp.]
MLLSVQLMSGCAGTGGPGQASSVGDDLMREAQQAVVSGARLRAQTLLEDATRSNPTDKQPWIKLAQLHFEQGRYAQAITAGQEVLARDNANLDARSIVLVSSLRIAAKSLEELSASNQLAGDTRTEARKVTHLLRETLGETVLVPANKSAALADHKGGDDAGTVEKAPVKRTVRPARSKPVAPKPATANSSTGDSDPFRSLR